MVLLDIVFDGAMEYRYGSHTIFKIQYHFVSVTKYRYQILKGVVSKGYVHLLVSALPNMTPSKIIRTTKGKRCI